MAISVDGIPRNRAMVAKLDLPFPLLADEHAAAISAWGVYDPKARIALSLGLGAGLDRGGLVRLFADPR